MRRKATFEPLLALAVLVLAHHHAKGAASPVSTRTTVLKTRTGGTDRGAWASSRRDALRSAGVAGDVALSVLAHWAFETAWGAGEWNFNLGNIMAGPHEPAFELPPSSVSPTSTSPGYFRAYGSLTEGVAAYLKLVRDGRYASCWAKLLADVASDEWIRCLGALGYYTDAPDHYAAGYLAARASLKAMEALT